MFEIGRGTADRLFPFISRDARRDDPLDGLTVAFPVLAHAQREAVLPEVMARRVEINRAEELMAVRARIRRDERRDLGQFAFGKQEFEF